MTSEGRELAPADGLGIAELAELFNAGFSDYLVPMALDDAAFRGHLAHNDIDLALSRVAVVDTPVAFVLVGRRGTDAWIGGMGTRPGHRRHGLGEALLREAASAASRVGCRAIWLEVLQDNQPAIALYAKLGFETVRELIVWSLPAGGAPGAVTDAVTIDERSAHAWISARRSGREPWQRADAALSRLRDGGAQLRGIAIGRDGETVAAAVFRDTPAAVSVLQLAAIDEAAAGDALAAAAGPDRRLGLANLPADDPASAALERLGATVAARQWEMRLRPAAARLPAGATPR
jgi:ribosomal protein S18 acetylase RimI-like enzyme